MKYYYKFFVVFFFNMFFSYMKQSKQKMSQIVEKVQEGGGSAKIKNLTLTEVGGGGIFRFFPYLDNWNMTLIFMIDGTDNGEICETFGTFLIIIESEFP